MKMHHTFLAAILIIALKLLSGCSAHDNKMTHSQTIPNSDYKEALKWTDPARHDVPAQGSPAEAEMLERVESLFDNYTREYLEDQVTKVYAEKLYFRDAFKQLESSDKLRDYFLQGLDPLEGAEFDFQRVIRSADEFYIDWIMRLDFEKTPTGTWEESIGMTHMRFNSEGKVIFHQDYWDPTDIVYKRIPVARQLINFVKKRM